MFSRIQCSCCRTEKPPFHLKHFKRFDVKRWYCEECYLKSSSFARRSPRIKPVSGCLKSTCFKPQHAFCASKRLAWVHHQHRFCASWRFEWVHYWHCLLCIKRVCMSSWLTLHFVHHGGLSGFYWHCLLCIKRVWYGLLYAGHLKQTENTRNRPKQKQEATLDFYQSTLKSFPTNHHK